MSEILNSDEKITFLKHPEIRELLWGKHLWNPSTYVETIGHISEDTVIRYIVDQKTK